MNLIIAPMLKEYHCAREALSLREIPQGQTQFRVSSGTIRKKKVFLLQTGYIVNSALEWFVSTYGKPEIMIDSGSCGSLSRDLEIGEIIRGSIIKNLSGEESSTLDSGQAGRTAAVLEVEQGVHSVEIQDIFSQSADVCTMESYQVFAFARERAIPFFCYRVVTDYADDKSREDFKRNIRPSCMKLYRFLKDLLLIISH